MVHHVTKVQQKCSEERDFRKFQTVKICGKTSIYAAKAKMAKIAIGN
jgi:hypothetical protein